MEENKIVELERENQKLREKLRKTEAREKQAENEMERAYGERDAIMFCTRGMLYANHESRALALIGQLWMVCREEMCAANRLRRQKAAWVKEEAALVKRLENPCEVCTGSCKEDGECVFKWNGVGAE